TPIRPCSNSSSPHTRRLQTWRDGIVPHWNDDSGRVPGDHNRRQHGEIRYRYATLGLESQASKSSLVEPMKSGFKERNLAVDSRAADGTEDRAQCPACESRNFRPLFEGRDRLYRTTNKTFRIIECGQCRLLRLFPQPDAGELQTYYPENYWFNPGN